MATKAQRARSRKATPGRGTTGKNSKGQGRKNKAAARVEALGGAAAERAGRATATANGKAGRRRSCRKKAIGRPGKGTVEARKKREETEREGGS